MYASSVIESVRDCRSCTLKHQGFFCHLTAPAAQDLEAIRSHSNYPSGAVLFMERDTFRGIYLLCTGKKKLTISSSGGKP